MEYKKTAQELFEASLKEGMQGGYVELVENHPEFDKGIKSLITAFKHWKNGPMTNRKDIKPCINDITLYVKEQLNKA